jgi:predicted DNA-binding transcriptional regulator AlpA
MANLDSKGEGPPSVRIGRSVAYPVRPLIEWMRQRSGEEA